MEIASKSTKGFTVDLREGGKIAVVRFLDRNLNFHVSETLRDDLKRTIDERARAGATAVLLDLGEVGVVDSCGVGVVIAACNHASSLGVSLGICRVSTFIDRVLEVMRLKRHLRLYATEEEGVAALSARS
ncbi:MAG: STAS domain-containing protein [Planctomycetota bacterium]